MPSKGRASIRLTAAALQRDGVPFYFVVEPQEEKVYRENFPDADYLVLPDNDRGLVFARNWIKEHSTANGDERHWQIDDNISAFCRMYRGRSIRCDANIALVVAEDFADRYENVALAGLNYHAFVIGSKSQPPFCLNVHVYSCTLVLNAIPNRFRPAPGGERAPANEDVDMCLQVLADGWCTVLINAFMVEKRNTMTVKGGQTDVVYKNDGRLEMARALERVWPGVVRTARRFKRPQHVVAGAWRYFTTPLIPKKGHVVDGKKYDMGLVAVAPVQSPKLRKIAREYNKRKRNK